MNATTGALFISPYTYKKEVVWLADPTHLITHRQGWQAYVYIAPSLQAQLENPRLEQRVKARASVAISFRKACEKKYPRFGLRFVEWSDMVVSRLKAPPSPTLRDPNGDDCDECASCEIGYHERCRNNCPIARR